MGEDEAKQCNFHPKVIGSITRGKSTSADTQKAAREMAALGVDLLLFAGGDGTARDVYEAVGETLPVLGIPAGVKIQSATFAVTPRAAGDLAARFLQADAIGTHLEEVMDIDEDAFRDDRISAKLFGYLKIPNEETMIQGAKTATPVDEQMDAEAIAADLVENWQDDCLYILGPGTTTRTVAQKLGVGKTLLGVDVVRGKELLESDVNEKQLLELVGGRKAMIIVGVIGGQGFIFGRGSQQISPEVIKKVGKENIVVVSTPAKLAALRRRYLLADTGDPQVDKMVSGYIQVVTGYGRRAVYEVKSH
jgi:predicted polyphosphate/ATP-dependent NAD kinase